MSADFEHADHLRELAEHEAPRPPEVDALRRRLRHSLRPRGPGRLVGWIVAATLFGALGVVAGLGAVGRLGSPRSRGLVAEVSEPAGTVRRLTDRPGVEVAVTAGVRVQSGGEGQAVVTEAGAEIDWSSGHLAVEVDPAAARRVRVTTPEARVEVIGTVFEVERGPFGTETRVSRGRVAVACTHDGARELAAGQFAWCFRDAGAGLGRVLFMESRGVDAASRLSVIDQALAHPVGLAATRQLLRKRRVGALAELGRVSEAIADARRLPEVARLEELSAQAEAAMARGGCADAEPWLVALTGAGDVTGALLRVQCLAPERPDAALRVLDELADQPLDPASADAVEAWQRALAR